VIDFRSRLPLTGKPDDADLGDALHAILAADFVNPTCSDRIAVAERIIKGYGLSALVKASDALAMVDRFRKNMVATFHPTQVLVEVPFSTANKAAQRVSGFMDLILETDRGWVLIDHKSFPGKRSDWASKAISFSGQLALYREALKNLGKEIASLWIHFAVSGGMVEVKLSASTERLEGRSPQRP
jgi:ATP-dependent exoDNAse (exonuclease V) beta subunit